MEVVKVMEDEVLVVKATTVICLYRKECMRTEPFSSENLF